MTPRTGKIGLNATKPATDGPNQWQTKNRPYIWLDSQDSMANRRVFPPCMTLPPLIVLCTWLGGMGKGRSDSLYPQNVLSGPVALCDPVACPALVSRPAYPAYRLLLDR